MVTIYFDKQLFSHLFKSQEEKYLVLREKILSHRDEFIFTYSNAHLFDLQQDTTDIKYDEMDQEPHTNKEPVPKSLRVQALIIKNRCFTRAPARASGR